MWKRIQPYFIITTAILLSTFLVWSPFLFRVDKWFWYDFGRRVDMLEIYKHWDGVLYVVVAKTFYFFDEVFKKKDLLGLSPHYFAAHLPLYPILIKITSVFVGYLKGMTVLPVIFAVFYGSFFYFMIKKLSLTKHPLTLTLVALFFTPRFFVIRLVPAPETIFLFFVLVSVYFFIKKEYLIAGLFGGLATLTKSPGILLFFGYCLYFLEELYKTKKIKFKWLWTTLIPLSLLGLFYFYQKQTGDFFAYFNSGDNIHLLFPPFQVFNFNANWVGTAWLEDIYFIFIFYGLALINLWQNKILRPAFYTVLLFFISIISVQHKDIARYSLPMLPFAIISYERFFTSKRFLIVFVILLPALYFFALNFLFYNQAPVTDWSTFK